MVQTISTENDVTLLIQDSANFIAGAINSWVSPINHYEENTKLVNQIYLETWAENINEFDSLQYAILYTIATESPLSGGDAVYGARVMLGIDVDDLSGNNNRILINPNFSNKDEKAIIIYPNPVSSKATITIKGTENEMVAIELKDLLGKVVLPFKKLNATGTIEFGNVPNGIYFLAVYLNGNYLSTDKLIVNH